jgi:hypothetical protein
LVVYLVAQWAGALAASWVGERVDQLVDALDMLSAWKLDAMMVEQKVDAWVGGLVVLWGKRTVDARADGKVG